ncbi:MAG: DUF3267 domain-containing protein [Christensenellales bacterium]
MKLIYKGNYKGEEQPPKGELPADAVRFDEPETPEELTKAAFRFAVPTVLLVALVVLLSAAFSGGFKLNLFSPYLYLGALLFLFALLPHELLHAICFSRGHEVELYVSFRHMMLFVVCVQPISKGRFIFMSLLPNLVLGWLPLLVWAVLPYGEVRSNLLFSFSVMAVLGGVGDYLNAFNALRQMPKGSMQQLSGFHSYWFMPKDSSGGAE